MIRRPPRSTQSRSSSASDVYKRQFQDGGFHGTGGHLIPVGQRGSQGAGDQNQGQQRFGRIAPKNGEPRPAHRMAAARFLTVLWRMLRLHSYIFGKRTGKNVQ